MGDLIHQQPVLALLIFLARAGDIASTYLATPNLKLEANPLMRRLGWRFGVATLALAGIPFIPVWGIPCGLVILVSSLLVTSGNLRGGWFARALGEERYAEVLGEAIRNTPAWRAYACSLLASALFASVGLVLMALYPAPGRSWAWWFAAGLLAYAFTTAVHHPIFLRRAYRRVGRGDSAA